MNMKISHFSTLGQKEEVLQTIKSLQYKTDFFF